MATRFGQTLDLLYVLSHQIHNRRLLYRLCLVNRTFADVFTSALWRLLEFNKHNSSCLLDDEKRQTVKDSRNLQHVRILTIREIEEEAPGADAAVQMAERHFKYPFNTALVELLQHMTGLECFNIRDAYLSHNCVSALSHMSCLRTLSIDFSYAVQCWMGMCEDPDEDSQYRIDVHHPSFGNIHRNLTHFAHLKSLSLLNIWGDMDPWGDCIVELMLRNRHLEHLSLSISFDAIKRASTPGNEDDKRSTYLLFEDVCNTYKQTSNNPLALRTLRLGEGIHFPDLETLSGVVNTAALQDIYIYNCSGWDSHWDVSWDILSAMATPSLQRLAFYDLHDGFWERIEEIFSADSRRTISLQSLITSLDRDKQLYRILDNHPQARIAQLLLPCDDLPTPAIDHRILSLRNNAQITHLGLSAELQYPSYDELDGVNGAIRLQTLCDLLGSLPNLQALWLPYGPDTATYDAIFPLAASLLEAVIAKMSKACRTLRYIRITGLAWHVYPEGTPNGPKLEMLDDWEDQIEGPACFQCTNSLPWGWVLHHIEL